MINPLTRMEAACNLDKGEAHFQRNGLELFKNFMLELD